MLAGETATLTGLAVTAGSAGAASPVALPVAGGGVVLTEAGALTAGAGVMMMENASDNRDDGYERGKGNKKINPKRVARKNGHLKSQDHPAPEGYVKYRARELETKRGKGARRDAHDAKDTAGRDRTKAEIDEDYDVDKYVRRNIRRNR